MNTALVCIAKNENYYIDEWIQYHIKLGFDQIFIYANDWEYSCNKNNVTVIDIAGNAQQTNAYNQFKQNLSQDFNWAAFFDVDEFLVLNKHKNLKEFLSEYADCNAIGINWAIFGNNGHATVEKSYSVLERFTKRNVENFIAHTIKPNSHIKTIVRLPCNHFQDIHNIRDTWFNLNKELRQGAFNEPIDWTIAQLNHYMTKSTEEFEIKCERGRADTIREKRIPKDYIEYLNSNCIEDLKALKFFHS